MTFRHVLNIVTVILMGLILYLAREELVQAWHLLFQVNIWILSLLIPLQLLSFFAVGEMIFTYLGAKRKVDASRVDIAKMALELNFVNHILPSGGVSGASYMTWRLGHFGVSAGRATIAQVVRYAASFAAFLALLGIAFLMITIDGNISRVTILVTSLLGSSIVAGILIILYVFDSKRRMNAFVRAIARAVNNVTKVFRSKLKGPVLEEETIKKFFEDLRHDYETLRSEPGILVKPFIWGVIFTLAEVAMFWVAYLSFGDLINPAPLLIAYGLATTAGLVMITPGGAGGYEVLMIAFLATAGINASVTVAAVVLTRTLLIIGTIITGYYFYHQALSKYGKQSLQNESGN